MGDLERLDQALVVLARKEAAVRLRLGQLLEVLGRGAVFELGFSSLGAYAVERCERGIRWAEAARGLARRLEWLPELRRAVATGQVSWSMGELVARVATPDDELVWFELARSRTVRQVRELVAQAIVAQREKAERPAAQRDAGEQADAEDDAVGGLSSGDEICTLTCTVDREEAWLFEATRCLLEQLGVSGAVAQCDALLAEAHGTLLGLLPEGLVEGCAGPARDGAQQRWVEQLRRWRDEAEALCETRVLAHLLRPPAGGAALGRATTLAVEASLGLAPLVQASCSVLDRQVRVLSASLAGGELELAVRLLRFHRVDGWRRLGYATEAQYARERLGMSLSSVRARRALAMRLEALPGVAAALGRAHIGLEAALQLVRIATPKTESAWVARARRRTVKHLREEVAAALVAVRWAGERDCPPPEDPEMVAFQTLEQTVVSGRLGLSTPAASRAYGAAGEPSTGGCKLAERPRRTPLRGVARFLPGQRGYNEAATSCGSGMMPPPSAARAARSR